MNELLQCSALELGRKLKDKKAVSTPTKKTESSVGDTSDAQAIERSLEKIRTQKNKTKVSKASRQKIDEGKKKMATEATAAKPKPIDPESVRLPSEGALAVRSSVGVQIYQNGKPAKIRNGKISVDKKSGKLSLNSPNLPYEIELNYRAVSGGVAIRINCNPWAIVKHNGISLGKTPQGPVAPGRRHRFSFLRPGQRQPVVVSLVWYPVDK